MIIVKERTLPHHMAIAIARRNERLKSERERIINTMVSLAESKNADEMKKPKADRCRPEITHRDYWALEYDLNHAPITTNRKQLDEIGVDTSLPVSASDLAAWIFRVAEGLAALNTYIINTNHLTDDDFVAKLSSIIDEEVRDICPGSGGREFIDMTGGSEAPKNPTKICDRDSTLPRPAN